MDVETLFDFPCFVTAIEATMLTLTGHPVGGVTMVQRENTGNQQERFFADFSAHLGLLAKDRRGLLVFASSKRCAERIVSLMLDLAVTQKIDGSISRDCIGEILNAAMGIARKNHKDKFDFTIPHVVQGINHEIKSLNKDDVQKADMMFEGEQLTLYLRTRDLSVPVGIR